MSLSPENFEQLLIRGLQGNMQDQLFKKLVDERMAILRTEIEAITREEVERYVIHSVHRLRDHLHQIEEVQIKFHYALEKK